MRVKAFTAAALLLLVTAAAAAQNISVADIMAINIGGGEAQSTVVPPGKKPGQCQQGRFLVTHDGMRPPEGVVWGRDLNQTNTAPVTSAFQLGALGANYDSDPTKTNYFFGTNDHDLVTLANGDVLYITGAFSRMPPTPPGGVKEEEPGWFKQTYRRLCRPWDGTTCQNPYDFGPGARTVVLVFRSTDCGQNFKFLSEVDPLRVGDGSCAQPQFRAKSPCKEGEDCRDAQKPWDMGGSDGQLVKLDPATGQIYLTFQCVGYAGKETTSGYVLDVAKKLNKTLVMASATSGTSWDMLGYVPYAAWRFGVAPLANGELGFGYFGSVLLGRKIGSSYTFEKEGLPASDAGWKWASESDFKDKGVTTGSIAANLWAHPVVARAPGSNGLVLVTPEVFGEKGFGYRVFFYDRSKKTLAEGGSITAAKASAGNLTLHLTAADPGSGPVLLYWTDVDSSAKTATVRGRFITGMGQYTEDFVVSQVNGAPRGFNLGAADYWYGDYQTAVGFVRKEKIELADTTRYEYLPMWIQPDGSIRYTRVQYTKKSTLQKLLPEVRELVLRAVPPDRWKPEPSPVELSRFRRVMTKERDMRARARQAVIRPGK